MDVQNPTDLSKTVKGRECKLPHNCQLPIFRIGLKYTKSPGSHQPILHWSEVVSFDIAVLCRTPGLRVQNFDSVSLAPFLKFMPNRAVDTSQHRRHKVVVHSPELDVAKNKAKHQKEQVDNDRI